MKIKSYLYIALFGLISLACARFEEEAIQESAPLVEMRLTACMDSEEAITKTYLDGQPVASVRNTYWLPEDAIGVTGSKNVAKFENICEDTTSVAFFEGQYESLNTYYAFYPYSADASFSSSDASLTLNIPQVQKYQENTFATDVVPMVAKFNIGDSLYFKNICGGFVVKMTGTEKVQSLRLTAYTSNGSDAKISGPFKVNMKSETFEMEPTESSMTSILVDCGDGVQLNEGEPTAFHFILPPAVYNGIKLLVTTTDGARMIKSTDKAVNIRRSNISYISAFKFEDNVVPVDLSQQGHSNCYIVPEVGIYSFDATVIGNGAFGMIDNAGFHTDDYRISPVSAEILWQDRSDVIYDVMLKDGRVHFLSDAIEGNALVAVKDADGVILWSWHIWCTDEPINQTYVNSSGTFIVQDRNLGATRGDRGVGEEWKESCGIDYLWGRKDPFMAYKHTEADINQILETIQNPTVKATSWDWNALSSSLWSESNKTIYDPCPVGYRVASQSVWNDFSVSKVSGEFDHGRYYQCNETEYAWYPTRAHHQPNRLDYWGDTYMMSSKYRGGIYSSAGTFHANTVDYGQLRCMKDEQMLSVLVNLKGVSDLTSTSAYASAEVVAQGDVQVEKSGYVIGTESEPTIDNARIVYSEANMGDISMTINDLSPITKYYIRAFAITIDNTIVYSSETIPFITPNDLGLFDLGAKESANCYIVYPVQSTYCFDLVKGNSDESVGEAVSAEILWETYGTVDDVVQGTVVKSASIKGGQVVFEIPDNAVPGNALIAVKDAEGTILWSWHIWVVDFDPELNGQLYPSGAILMDRHLGALTAVINDPRTNGLLYQWGRKDPFIGYVNSAEDMFASVVPVDAFSSNSSGISDYQYTISHPSESIIGTLEWCDGARWDVKKTIYDPCPPGWKVPDGNPGVWEGTTSQVIIHRSTGMTLSSVVPEAYYPTSGYVDSNGNGDHATYYGWVWTCSLNNNEDSDYSDPYAFVVSSFGNGTAQIGNRRNRAHHFNVRCMKINDSGETGTGNDYIVDDEYEW